MPLNERQRVFAREYVLTLRNGAEAARRAGYSVKSAKVTASQLLTNPNVRAEIESVRARFAEEAGLDRAYVLTKLQALVERGLQEVPVLDREGKETGEYTFQGAVANKALETLIKMLGLESAAQPVAQPTSRLDELSARRERLA